MSDYTIKKLGFGGDCLELGRGLELISERWRNILLRLLYGRGTGEMEIVRNGREIHITSTEGSFSAVYAEGGSVEGVSQANLGAFLTGMTAAEFYEHLKSNMDIPSLQQKRSLAESECKRLEAEMMQSRKTERLSALHELRIKRTMRDEAEQEHLSAQKYLEDCRAALRSCRIGDRDPDEVGRIIKADVEKSIKLKKIADISPKNTVQTLVLIFGILLAMASALYIPEELMAYTMLAAAALCFLSVFLFIRGGRLRNAANEAAADRLEILNKYGADSEADIVSMSREFMSCYNAYKDARSYEIKTALELEKMNRQLSAQSESSITKLDFSSGSSEAVLIAKRLNGTKLLLNKVMNNINSLKNAPGCLMIPLDNSEYKLYYEKSMNNALLDEIAGKRQILAFPWDEE